jgi:hypothetical protein
MILSQQTRIEGGLYGIEKPGGNKRPDSGACGYAETCGINGKEH